MLRVAQNRPRILQGMRSAIQFLTIFPCPSRQAFNARAALPYFPICGLLIGTALVVIDALAALIWPRPVVAMVDVIALAVISGALHLDGLADTADGLYGRRGPEQALSIMKDSRIGAMGMIAVLCCFGLKWVGLANIGSQYKVWLLITPAYARASVLFGIKRLPYGRPGGGTGHAFFEPPLQVKDFWALGLVAALSILTSWRSIAINACFLMIVWAVIGWYRYKINCITGDMLGALIEVTETALFLLAASHWNQ
ncbi:MAG: adenosylcobinamide-GDP ribazoletransferase [Desulfobacteraceae bacterium]|jgi:adenosylcobinamide-GDP ribazoletransferase